MTMADRQGGNDDAAAEEQQGLLAGEKEDVTVLDFDMLCATVALQVQEGKWAKLNAVHQQQDEETNNNNNNNNVGGGGGGVFRMWEGELVHDCLEDRRLALQSTCCPSYRFGKNMKRAGFGSCFLQASFHLILLLIALFNLAGCLITGKRCFLYLAIVSTVSIATYAGFYRMQIRKKFNIKGSDSSLDDCAYHLVCPCCTLCQESRTLEMNNVHDGIWHGRGDTICVGNFSNDIVRISEFAPPLIVSTKSPEFLTMQKNSNCSTDL